MVRLSLDEDVIIGMYENGESLVFIGNTFGCAPSTIKLRLQSKGIKIRSSGESRTGLKRCYLPDDEIINLYNNNKSLDYIGKLYNCDPATIKKWLLSNGVKLRSVSEAHDGIISCDLPDEDVVDMYINGSNLNDIAERFNCSAHTIRNRLVLHGVKVRSLSEAKIGICKICLPVNEVVEMYNNGNSPDMIGKHFLCSDTPIHRILEENNITLRSKDESMKSVSARFQNIPFKDWTHYIPKARTYVKPIPQCISINERFAGSEGHHIAPSTVVFIPSELHRHINHNIKTGENMGEMNMLALQFINGGYDG